ncbi:TRIO and F-actin-binding protein [Acipenser oxyrinchus oxyrinchus]|uniref:TRIO and F-actin-binding protein n=1 Tax=Acipenser oxyrinchus oxyrinchus TaxID=40147 RepID=A0AAD8CTX8_ACIOX|nr:TRIO and F-actin-binding protein [Acipenser oxyrinchus oxyrinchus]
MTPDLLNFKKGWMSKLDEKGEWKRHWFVLTDAGLRYYRDSNAEEVTGFVVLGTSSAGTGTQSLSSLLLSAH